MFKKLLLNKEYEFNLVGDFIHNGEINHNHTDLMEISINGEILSLSRKWLGLIAHYEVNLCERDFLDISFVDCVSRVIGLKCKKLMVIKKPLRFRDDYFLIPGFLNFAITKLGQVCSVKYGTVLKPSVGPYGYPYVNVYDPDKGRWRSISLHILLARTFIPNPDPTRQCFVNHKDGNKLNFNLLNLEWVSSRENNTHAVKTGLRSDNSQCLVRNIVTKEIVSFDSLTLAFRSIGYSAIKPITRNNGVGVYPVLFKNKFELKLKDDNSPWFYSDIDTNNKFRISGPFQAKHVPTNKIYQADTISGISKLIGLSEDKIFGIVRNSVPTINDDFYVRVKTDNAWPDKYDVTKFNKIRKIRVTNTESNEIIDFVSQRQLMRNIGIDKRTLKNRLASGRSYKGWIFSEFV